ncbi:related to TY3B-TY3B protein [Fusarium fujikuroi]|nr:related to TY3B-TY3B protein [Fusarium fujikuroi]
MSEGSDDDSASRRHRGATVDTTQSTGDLSKKIRKETLGIFDPDNPDDKDNQGLITTSSGKTIYTDVFMFCEHLSVFKRFGEYSLTDYYVGMLSGKASAWLMSELDSPSRNRLLNLPITEFGRKLTERFKRPDTDILNELHSSRYTPKVAARGITLAQQCEQRRTTIKQFCRSNDRGDRNDQRYKSGYSSSRDKGSRSDRRSHDESSSSRRRDDYDRSKRDDRYRSDRPSRSYTDARKSDDKHGKRRHDGNRNRHTHSRDNDYMRKDVKEEKKVHWERKYPVMEEEDELGPDKVDTDGDSESVCSSRSTSSEEAYLTYMTGNISYLDGQKELFCGTCQRSFPSRAVLWEHSLARTCIKPAQLAREQAPAKSKRCNHCRRDFLSRNRLHRHLKTGCASQMMTASESGNALQVSETTVTSANKTSARAHHRPQVYEVDGNYTHLKFDAMSSPGGETVSVCADTGCGKPVISREWLQTLDHTIEQKTPVFIRGVNDKVGKPHTEWATFTFYVNSLDKNGADARLAEYTYGAWVQDGMPSSSPRALLGNGWMAPYGINIMTTDRRLHCTSLEDFYIPFTISQLSRRVSRRVIVARPTTVPAGQTRLVPASWKEVPKGRTFMFNGCVAEASDALISSDTAPGVVIVNNSDKDITFQRKQKLGNIEECEEDEMYFSSTWKAAALALLATAGMATTGTSGGAIDVANVKISSEIDLTPEISAIATGEIVPRAINTPQVSISGIDSEYTTTNAIRDMGSAILEDIKEAELPYKQQKKNKKKQPLSKVAELLSNQPAASAATGSALPLIGEPEATVSESVPTTPYIPYQVHVQKQPNLPEIVTQDGIHIYDDGSGFARQAQDLCAKYATLWIDSGLIHVPEDELMTVPLVDNWHEQRVSQRPYACGLKDRNLIDQIFDRLYDQKWMEWVTKPTPFAAPVFVVWRIVDGKPKGRAVVNLRALNKVTIPDSYPLPRQEDVIAALRGATHISAINASSFFFQFGVALEHQDRFTITSHRGLERSTIAPIGFCNSPAYAQRYIDRLLRPYRSFCRAFINDIVIFSKSAAEHARHMDTLFRLFISKNLSISPTKSWIGYPSAQVLGFRVDALGLSTTAERVAAFAKLKFPRQLAALKQYIGATGYIRHLIPYYAKIMEPLQKRKVALLAEGRRTDKIVNGNRGKRKSYTKNTYYDPTPAEKIAFQTIQEQIASSRGLVHLNPKKRLFLQLDASIQRGFGAVLYHIKDGYIWKEGT